MPQKISVCEVLILREHLQWCSCLGSKEKMYGEKPKDVKLENMTWLAFLQTLEKISFFLNVPSTLSLSLLASLHYWTGETPRVQIRVWNQDPLGLWHRCGPCVLSLGSDAKAPQQEAACIWMEHSLHPLPCWISTVAGYKPRIWDFGILPNSFSNTLKSTDVVNSKLAQLLSPKVLVTSIFPTNPPCH